MPDAPSPDTVAPNLLKTVCMELRTGSADVSGGTVIGNNINTGYSVKVESEDKKKRWEGTVGSSLGIGRE